MATKYYNPENVCCVCGGDLLFRKGKKGCNCGTYDHYSRVTIGRSKGKRLNTVLLTDLSMEYGNYYTYVTTKLDKET
jgi:hypothetical protein